jgi:hypothetical protein
MKPVVAFVAGLFLGLMIAFVVGGTIVLMLSSRSAVSPESQSDRTGRMNVDPMKIIEEYMVNEASADGKYLNKKTECTIVIAGVEKDLDGRYYAWWSFMSPHFNHKFAKFYFRRTEQAASLKFDQQVTIRGVFSGKKGTVLAPDSGLGTTLVAYPAIRFNECELAK